MAATAASIAASAKTARPRLVCSTVPVRLNSGRRLRPVLLSNSGEAAHGDVFGGRRDAPARSQRGARVLQGGANRLRGNSAAESLDEACRSRRAQDRIDRGQIAQAGRSLAVHLSFKLRLLANALAPIRFPLVEGTVAAAAKRIRLTRMFGAASQERTVALRSDAGKSSRKRRCMELCAPIRLAHPRWSTKDRLWRILSVGPLSAMVGS